MPSFDSLARHVRFAARNLIRDRGFTVTALLTFALCLGANLAMFAVLNASLLRPLPFPEPDRLVAVHNAYPKAGVERIGSSIPHYLERRAGVTAFEEMAAIRSRNVTLVDGNAPDRVSNLAVTPSFFRLLRVSPALGRTFTEEEGNSGANNVAVLTDGFWRTKFNADPNVIGRTLKFAGGNTVTVVGVLPAGFHYLSEHAVMFTSFAFSENDRSQNSRHSNNMFTIARLRPGATLAAAQAQVDAINAKGLETDRYKEMVIAAGFHTTVSGLHDSYVADTRAVLLLLQAGVLLLLLIGGVNLTNLFLVRASARAKEISVRQVLGAGRGDLAAQFMTEALLVTLLGGLLGLALGWAGVRGLEVLGADQLPHAGTFSLDRRVVIAGLLASVLAGVLLALPVIWNSMRGKLAASLSVESRGGTTSRAAHRLRHSLIATQFALAFVLLAGAGLLGLSFTKVLEVKPGFHAGNLLTGQISLPSPKYRETSARLAAQQRLAAELAAIPGVTHVGFSTGLPFTGSGDKNAIQVEGHELAPGESLSVHVTSGINGDYFPAMGITLREGRLITADDTARNLRVAVIDEDVARRYWPNRSPLGAKIYNGVKGDSGDPFEVVGVVGRITYYDLADTKPLGSIYYPFAHYSSGGFYVTLRTAQTPAAATSAMRAAVLRVDPELPVEDLKPMELRIDESLVSRRGPMWLAAIFAGVALVLAAVGLYGVLAYAVAQRRREIGVRMALGAQPAQIRRQFLGLGTRLMVIGAALGMVGAWFAGSAMQSLLFGVQPGHPWIYALAAGVLGSVALIACVWPAARAARVPPMEALRSD